MDNNYEIERKFLIDLPEIDLLDVRRFFEIHQTYLNKGRNGSQRRVRMISENGAVTYFYTEKIFYSPVVRKEDESEISSTEYKTLLADADSSHKPILKTRYVFNYLDQRFEMDIYPFSGKYAILELELKNEDQEIYFPDTINVVKEVTGDNRYSNASLADAGGFPEITD